MTESSSGNFGLTGDFPEFSADLTANWQERIGEPSADIDLDATIAPHATASDHEISRRLNALASLNTRHLIQDAASAPHLQSDYVVDQILGEGAMGVVYQAQQTSLDRTVCVKTSKEQGANSKHNQSQFLREATLTGQLEHPHIVPVYDVGNDGTSLFYSMKRIDGIPWCDTLAGATEIDNLRVLESLCNAVAFAHSRGILHRDLKPENVMVGDYGEVLLVDWGLGITIAECQQAAPHEHGCCGSPAYMSPEMAMDRLSNIGPHSDIYLLGAILYEICTGHQPHSGNTLLECLQHAAANRIEPTSRDDELLQIAMHAMETDPATRYNTVQEFQDALRVYAEHQESRALTQTAEATLEQAQATGDFASRAPCNNCRRSPCVSP